MSYLDRARGRATPAMLLMFAVVFWVLCKTWWGTVLAGALAALFVIQWVRRTK